MKAQVLCLGTLRAHQSRPKPVERAAAHADQFNESAPSNQQDLIGQMETNRQQETPRGRRLLLQPSFTP